MSKKKLGLPLFFEGLHYAKILQRLFVCTNKTRYALFGLLLTKEALL